MVCTGYILQSTEHGVVCELACQAVKIGTFHGCRVLDDNRDLAGGEIPESPAYVRVVGVLTWLHVINTSS